MLYYLRLRNVSLSYVFPSKWLSRAKIGKAVLSINADNLWTLTKFSGMDPDVGLNVEAYSLPGLSYLKYPISRQLAVGLNIEF